MAIRLLTEEDLNGVVKTVNGVVPDENGNVEVDAGSGESGSTSVTARVVQTDSGAVIYIADKDGTTEAIVTNGKDGYTPKYGVDYWTEEDKAEIKSYVDTAILGGAW